MSKHPLAWPTPLDPALQGTYYILRIKLVSEKYIYIYIYIYTLWVAYAL